MTRLIIVRHGNTFESDETVKRIGARTDLPLTEHGIGQAEKLGRWLHDRGMVFAQAFTGPLIRAQHTAQLVLDVMNPSSPEARPAWWLDEVDYGPDEGRAESEVTARIGKAALVAWDVEGRSPPGWQVDRARRIAAWKHFLSSPPAGDSLLVTSNGAARYALIAGSLTAERGLKLRTGAYGELARNADGNWRLCHWDVRPHPLE